MNHLKITVLLLCLGIIFPLAAQVTKKPMTFDDLTAWKRITDKAISDDGKWIACKMEPWIGDPVIHVFNVKGKKIATFEYGDKMEFASSSDYLVITRKPSLKETEELKIKKTKEEKMPMNQLILFHLPTGKEEIIDSLKSYKLSASADWIAYQRGNKTDSSLYIRSIDNAKLKDYPLVTDYSFAKKENILYYISKGDSIQTKAGLYTYIPANENPQLIYEGEGVFKNITFNEKGNKLAFLYCADKDSTATNFSLYLSDSNADPQLIADRNNISLSNDRIISEHGTIRFSENPERLFFGTAPVPKQKDTTILAENRPNIQIWKWDEKIQYTQQTYNKDKDLKKTYTTVYHIDNKRTVLLSNPELPDLIMNEEGNASYGLLTTSYPYGTERMWTGRDRFDIYRVDIKTGENELIKKGLLARPKLSPKGKYAFWYCPEDSSWYTYSMGDKKEYRLTTPSTFTAWQEKNDVPDYPSPHGIAGWTKEDNSLLIYDRYDIWQFDPTGENTPVNLTVNGRKNKVRYFLIPLDKDEKSIDLNHTQLVSGFNETTKSDSYYNTVLSSPSAPKELLSGSFLLKAPVKAKKANTVIYTKETFEQYPDIQLTDIGFRNSIRLTDGFKQQETIRWGSAELTSWTSLDGKKLEGIIYKPENFDPKKKYPLLVNFYEQNSETLYSYRMPEPHRSTIDYHLYNSNEYIVFNPDIAYKTGYPGESCFNSVMPGIASLIEKGYINEKAIAAQGHSWGGYQVAYLATRTNLFAAIESGAPVVNMFSAYGGIRWGSGLNRSFQYEHTQSRIGATIWETPLRYFENSPLFTMDKVTTPILIMHNDNDGHVPWYQGIEYFIALKRLQKPVWMLNYPGEIHWPMKIPNRVDFQKRMFQFFGHYLKNESMPKWMDKGIPAVDQDFELGYEIE